MTDAHVRSADRLRGIRHLREILRVDPVARRLTLGIVLFSTFIAVITTSIQLYVDYRLDVAGIERRFDEIRRVEIPFLVNSVWVVDPVQIQTQLDGLARLQDIESLIVSIDGQPRWSAGTATSIHRLARRFPLVYRYRDTDLTIGELEVVASLDDLRARILDKLVVVLLSNGVKTFLVGIFALFLFYSLVTRHIARATHYLRQENLLTPTAGDFALERQQHATSVDFLDELAAAINDLRRNSLASERRLFGFFVGSPAGMSIFDHEGRWTYINPTAVRASGSPAESFIGRRPRDVLSPALAAGVEAAIERVLSTGQPEINLELSGSNLADPGRIRHYLCSLFPLALSAGRVAEVGSVVIETTAWKETEERLRQSQKMDAIGQLTGGVAHDFNNILTVITGTIGILADAVADRPDLAAITGMIDDAAARGATLTQQLLAFSRKQPLQPRSIDVNAMILDAANLLKPTLGEHIEIETALEHSPWFAVADPSQLSTALINLAINARDAMPGGGRLTFESGNVVLDEAYAQANPDAVPGPYVMIAVSDTGTGIPAAIRDRVFEPFFTTKEIGRGTGLGLSMVYGFVKQSRGHIKIYSEEGHGTTIRLYLPRIAQAPSAEAAVAEPRTIPGGHEAILVVEDDDLVRNYVLVQLGSLGYTMLSARNAAEALAIVDGGAGFDLLFTDVILTGGLNGRQLADEVKKRRPGMRVLFTSGYTENAIIHHGRLDPGVVLLAKPYHKADLARKIREVLG